MYDFYSFKLVKVCLWLECGPILMNVPCKLEKTVYFIILDKVVYTCQLYTVDGVVEFNYIFADFLLVGSVHF